MRIPAINCVIILFNRKQTIEQLKCSGDLGEKPSLSWFMCLKAQSRTDRKGVTPVLLTVVRHGTRVHCTSLLCLSSLEKRGGGMKDG